MSGIVVKRGTAGSRIVACLFNLAKFFYIELCNRFNSTKRLIVSQPFNSEVPQSSFPSKIPPPLFNLGTNVCWNSVSGDDTDCDLILGMRYIWGKHLQDWQYQYYVALHADSPSYQWAKFDWGWQGDLTIVPSKGARSNSKERNDQ